MGKGIYDKSKHKFIDTDDRESEKDEEVREKIEDMTSEEEEDEVRGGSEEEVESEEKDSNESEEEEEATEKSAERDERNSGLSIDEAKKTTSGRSLPLVLLIAIFVAVFMIVRPFNHDGQEGTKNENSSVESSELGSGDVSVTIDGKTIKYAGAYVVDGVDTEINSGTYESTKDDEAVFLVINGGSLKIDGDVEINKTGSEDFQGRGDNYSFYGMNSAIVVVGEDSSASINGATIKTDVSGANAVVSTDGGEVVIEDSKISTTKDNSRGLHATYGGSINASKVEISTLGGSCASLATDRGEGTIVADNMTLSTAGAGSPLIYSTGSITVTDSKGTATGAQIAVVEGKNSISLDGCDFSAYGNGNRKGIDNAGVMIYQSMSGDAGEGTGTFEATDCTLAVLPESEVYDETPFFFVTNTTAEIELTDTEIDFSDSKQFISALGTSEWGKSGSNGGNVTLTASGLIVTNTKVEVDSISSVEGL
ncbi:hypothetical protein IIY24_00665 [Candidatus Saccharibacteria bacterium]|nr:hypothetical protein [Candidatus Saccharibacteria bacterium]